MKKNNLIPQGKAKSEMPNVHNSDTYSVADIELYYNHNGFSPATELLKEINIDTFFKSKFEKVSSYLREKQLRDILENAKERNKKEHKLAKIDSYLQYKKV